ncbi:glycosyltransferase family 4 protein [Pseudomonas sp. 5P_5.1_Bac1]|uniref:glycosyltransferase family 4 protein n=1 Tax=Pseudomonas sp. 5P_5.1_Bac1 TaxID=2971616 RepID=UPI0021C80A28|nr:glycosyltransferase family 4 protein [Pseudomonas sp. 5P_5.1_Bac1]MCU1722224.1 glycosyltransferase family 4 protein [Pseudomonas sp. 5P_5.1_Bac1]
MERILLLTTKYPCRAGEGWLTNELADCFAKEGKSVSVLVLSWEYSDGESAVIDLNGVRVYRLRLWKIFYNKNIIFSTLKIFLFSALVRFRHGRVLRDTDLIVATTPCIVIWALLDFFWKKTKAKKYLILWDFFPYYMRDLWGAGKSKLFSFFLRWENRLYRKFDAIGCMTKGSIDFLESHYKIDPEKVSLLPLWTKQLHQVVLDASERSSIRAKYGIIDEAFVVIYGGAMSVVQGLDNILDLASHSKAKPQFQFVLIGKGSELARLKARVQDESLHNVLFIDHVPRDEYEKIIAACDLGLVSLSGNHAVPSFPSKSIDYLKVGLPILASIDKYTEFGGILTRDMKAGLWVEAGNPVTLAEALERMYSDSVFLSECAKNGRQYYEQEMKVDSAIQKILFACEDI